ncbi:hypothetical protein PV762_23585 [Mitsuaria sp. CC2]|uniref:HipA family kinase n=1 Tax=Mitsuaria sp. CC2 TaxID=3029186 RepID=UPI003B8B88AB
MPYSTPPRLIQLTEVIRVAEQGMTKPILCRAEDGRRYYVKGQQTDRASLWREWIAGYMALALGLPIAPFVLVQANEFVLRELSSELRLLGSTPAFGSAERENATWYENSLSHQVDARVRQAVLVFDWWVKNGDRQVGNTNMLWETIPERLVIIDHNQAFDDEFDTVAFVENHVFASEWDALTQDAELRAAWTHRMSQALVVARWALENAPHEWRWANAEQDIPAAYDPERALRMLSRCVEPDFWSVR